MSSVTGATTDRPPGKKRKLYPAEALKKAIEEIPQLGLNRAAERYGIPRATLSRYNKHSEVHGRSPVLQFGVRSGPPPALSRAEEAGLVATVMAWHGRHMSLSKAQLFALTVQFAQKKLEEDPEKEPFSTWVANGRPSDGWFTRFMLRWPELSYLACDPYDHGRNDITEEELMSFFHLMDDVIKQHPEMAQPVRIYNCDEMNIMPDGKKVRVLAPRGARHTHRQQNQGRFSFTVLPCIRADGHQIPPLVIVAGSGKRRPRFWGSDEMTDGLKDTPLEHSLCVSQVGSVAVFALLRSFKHVIAAAGERVDDI